MNNVYKQHLSTSYTLDTLQQKQIENTLKENYNEHTFYQGQKGLANFIYKYIIKTPDGKMMLCCTDISRKKFKILDFKGNLKDDTEARIFIDKLHVPIKMISDEIYKKIEKGLEDQQRNLGKDERATREKLLDNLMRAQETCIDINNFDDPKYNQDFMHELCVLLNV